MLGHIFGEKLGGDGAKERVGAMMARKERSLYLDVETGFESDMLTNSNGSGSKLCLKCFQQI